MSLFHFGKRKRPDSPPPQLNNGPPRDHHYAFAHVVFRSLALNSPLQCLGILASEQAREFLQFAYDQTCEACREHGEPDFTPDEVTVHCGRVGNYPSAVLQMPPPVGTTEAYFVAVVALVDTTGEPPADIENIPARFFTLEKGISFDESERTVLGEWTDTTHSNYGTGPEPTVSAFVRQITSFLEKES